MEQELTIYHNSRCSKSRQTLELLQSKGYEPLIVEYLKTPLNLEELKRLRVHFELKDFVRSDEQLFKELNLSFDREEELLKAMVKEPLLMLRPIVTLNGRARIGRPPERVLELFNY
jgi:arsenate reductase